MFVGSDIHYTRFFVLVANVDATISTVFHSHDTGKNCINYPTVEVALALTAHTWPGNVRELENTLRAAAIRSSGTIVSARHLDLATADKPTCDLRLARDELERGMVERALQRNGGIISRAARDLAISRVTLYELLQKHGFRSANGRGKNT